LREQALRQRFDFDFERALLAEHGLDAAEPCAAEQA